MTLRTPFVFLLGIVVGLAAGTGVAQDRRLPGNNGVNHLAFATTKYAEMMEFYTQTLGFAEAFSNRNAGGHLELSELAPGAPARKAMDAWK